MTGHAEWVLLLSSCARKDGSSDWAHISGPSLIPARMLDADAPWGLTEKLKGFDVFPRDLLPFPAPVSPFRDPLVPLPYQVRVDVHRLPQRPHSCILLDPLPPPAPSGGVLNDAHVGDEIGGGDGEPAQPLCVKMERESSLWRCWCTLWYLWKRDLPLTDISMSQKSCNKMKARSGASQSLQNGLSNGCSKSKGCFAELPALTTLWHNNREILQHAYVKDLPVDAPWSSRPACTVMSAPMTTAKSPALMATATATITPVLRTSLSAWTVTRARLRSCRSRCWRDALSSSAPGTRCCIASLSSVLPFPCPRAPTPEKPLAPENAEFPDLAETPDAADAPLTVDLLPSESSSQSAGAAATEGARFGGRGTQSTTACPSVLSNHSSVFTCSILARLILDAGQGVIEGPTGMAWGAGSRGSTLHRCGRFGHEQTAFTVTLAVSRFQTGRNLVATPSKLTVAPST